MRLRAVFPIAMATLATSCYTQVRNDVPGIPTSDPRRAETVEPAPKPKPKPDPIQPLSGEYAGYVLQVSDAGKHAMSDVRFWFTPKTYRCQGDDIQPGSGTYTLDDAVLALADYAESESASDLDRSRLLTGRFEVQQAGDWVHLVQRDGDGSYREIGIAPAAKKAAPRP